MGYEKFKRLLVLLGVAYLSAMYALALIVSGIMFFDSQLGGLARYAVGFCLLSLSLAGCYAFFRLSAAYQKSVVRLTKPAKLQQ